MTPAKPKFAVGEVVTYVDRQQRQQQGAVWRVEASWSVWSKGKPLIIYTLWHPTYRNNTFYTTDKSIHGVVA